MPLSTSLVELPPTNIIMLVIQLVTVSPRYCLMGKRRKGELITIPASTVPCAQCLENDLIRSIALNISDFTDRVSWKIIFN